MKMIDVIEEQLLQKMKEKLSDVGKKIGNLSNKVQDTVKPEINPVMKKHMEFVEKYKNINQDPNSNMVYVEGNDGGNPSSMLLNRLKMQAISFFTKRELNKNPGQNTLHKQYQNVKAVDWSCYTKLDDNSRTVTYCAYVFEVIS